MNENNYKEINKLFSKKVIRQIGKYGTSPIYNNIVNKYINNPIKKTNLDIFQELYLTLQVNYKNELIYKNNLFNQLYVNIKTNEKILFSELHIAISRLDMAIINDNDFIAYEIKSDLDSLDRLDSQINNYYKVTPYVNIITTSKNINDITNINPNVGISILTKDNLIQSIKQPIKNIKQLDKLTIFKMMRKYEYTSLIYQIYNKKFNVSDFDCWETHKNLFLDAPLEKTYPIFLNLLKNRKKVEDNVLLNIPFELRFLVYDCALKEKEVNILNNFLKSNYFYKS